MVKNLSVCILSDNRLFRESLGRILSKRGDFEIASSQGLAEISREANLNADVIVLDSVEFLIVNRNLLRPPKASCEHLRILLVAMEEDGQLFLQAIRAGAVGFIPKDASSLDVVAAVRSVARGEAVCPPRFCKVLFDFVAAQLTQTPSTKGRLSPNLTRREQQLVPMIGRGLTNKEIAQQLNLSEQTIKNHIHRILYKLGVENRMDIVAALQTPQLPNLLRAFGQDAGTSRVPF